MENTDNVLDLTLGTEDESVVLPLAPQLPLHGIAALPVKVVVKIDVDPQLHLIDIFWNAFRVQTDIMALIAQIPPSNDPVSVDVVIESHGHPVTIRFVQGRKDDNFGDDHGNPRLFDILLPIDTFPKSIELFKKGMGNALETLRMRDHGAIPFLVNTVTEASIINSAWTDTIKINSDIFAAEKPVRYRYAHFRSAANALYHILETAVRLDRPASDPFTVVLLCKAGKERSLLMLLVFLTMLHGNYLMQQSPLEKLADRISYMKGRLSELQLDVVAPGLTQRATAIFKTYFNSLGFHLAMLPVVEVKKKKTADKDGGIKRTHSDMLHQCFHCKTMLQADKVDHCPFTRMIVCNKNCLISAHANIVQKSGLGHLIVK